MSERWLAIPDWDGYEISDLGRVRSLKGRGGKPVPHIMRTRLDKAGYPEVTLHEWPRKRTWCVHRLVALAFLGPRPDGLEVRHLDGNPTNNRLQNLAYGTRAENARDAVAHGTHRNVTKTHCPQGHRYDETNTYRRRARPGRVCITCRNNARNTAQTTAASASPVRGGG